MQINAAFVKIVSLREIDTARQLSSVRIPVERVFRQRHTIFIEATLPIMCDNENDNLQCII